MNWRELVAVVEAAASFAVVISLIYLAIQVRLQAKENQMAVINSLTQQWGEALRTFATDKDLYDIWMKGIMDFDSLSANERGRLSAILVTLTQIFESLHLHHRAGKVDPGLWEGFDNRLRDVFATPGVQCWWTLRKHWHTRRFQEYVDRAIAAGEKQKGRYAALYGASVNGVAGPPNEIRAESRSPADHLSEPA